MNADVTITKSDVGLGSVDNTSDANKPVSTAQQVAIDADRTRLATLESETVTKTSMAIISGEGINANPQAPGAADFATRALVSLPVKTSRWRLRVRNFSAALNTAGGGPVNITGVWVGPPNFPATGDSRWRGNFSSAPMQAISAFQLAAGSADFTTTWVSDATQQFSPGIPQGISIGINNIGLGAITLYSDPHNALLFAGGGVSADAGATLGPGGTTDFGAFAVLDIRLEHEFTTSAQAGIPLYAIIGDSHASAYTSDATMCLAHYENWPGAAALGGNFACTNLAIGGTGYVDWAPGTGWRWDRGVDWTKIEGAIVSLGSNDVLGRTTAQIKTDVIAVITKLRSLGVKRIYLGLIIPRNFGAPAEAIRVAVNAWLRTLPAGVDGCFDFDYVTASATGAVTLDSRLIFSTSGSPYTEPHLLAGGYQRMASIVRVAKV